MIFPDSKTKIMAQSPVGQPPWQDSNERKEEQEIIESY